jgi:hypothetical protein
LWSVSRVAEIVGAFCGCEGIEKSGDAAPEAGDRTLTGLAEKDFEFGEQLLDRIKIGERPAGRAGIRRWLARIGRRNDSSGCNQRDGSAEYLERRHAQRGRD